MPSKKQLFYSLLCFCALVLFGFYIALHGVRPNRSLSANGVEPTSSIPASKPTGPLTYVRKFLNVVSDIAQVTDTRPDKCASCFKNDFNFIINQDACASYDLVELLVLIVTAPKDGAGRQAIRETWGTLCTKERHIACVFVLGAVDDSQVMTKVKSESSKHSDIVQLDFRESYGNLTYKTMSGFRWSRDYCSKARFIMKVDGDMYLNLELLPVLLLAVPSGKFLGGNCWGEQSPHRSKSSKWYVSFQSYPHKNFPPICSGTAYVISSDFLHGLMDVSRNLPYFHLEDVFIGMAAKSLGIRPVSLKGFSNLRAPFKPCSYRNEVMTSHYIDPVVLRRFWKISRQCPLKNHSPRQLFVPKYI